MPCDFLTVQAYDHIVLARIEKARLLDVRDITAVAEELTRLLDRYPRISLVLDLEAVVAMSSAALGKLVALHKAVTGFKGRLMLAGVKPSIMPLFTVTKLDKILAFAATAQEAILLYKRKPL
jgi:anti-sigma B factor antagonist